MMEWNRSWTGSLILLIGYLLFESFASVFFFFFFSLCVRRTVYKIVRSIFITRMVEERKGSLHSEKLGAICSGEEIIIQPVTSSYFEMNFPSLFRLQ